MFICPFLDHIQCSHLYWHVDKFFLGITLIQFLLVDLCICIHYSILGLICYYLLPLTIKRQAFSVYFLTIQTGRLFFICLSVWMAKSLRIAAHLVSVIGSSSNSFHLSQSNIPMMIIINQWVECSPMVQETWLQSQVASYQRLLKWYLIPPWLTLSNIMYVSRVKWSNPGKRVPPSPTLRCSCY